jgi:hypothetical protein
MSEKGCRVVSRALLASALFVQRLLGVPSRGIDPALGEV